MQDFSDKQIESSLFANSCLTSKGIYLPFIDPEESKVILKPCFNPHRTNIVTCQDDSLKLFLEEVGSLDFDVRLSSTIDIIPSYVPVVDYETLSQQLLPKDVIYFGLTLKDIIKSGFIVKAGRIHERKNISYHSSLLQTNSLKGKRIILFLSAEDTIIESVWHKRSVSMLFETLGRMNFYCVTGFNFSLFQGECPFSHALNLKKSLYSSRLLEKFNIPAIPHIYALNRFHIQRWIHWFKDNPLIRYFTTNCQLQKSDLEIGWVVSFVTQLLIELPYLHVILQGFEVCSLYKFGDLLKRVHLVNKKPVKRAIGQKQLVFDEAEGMLETINVSMSRSLLISHNIHHYKKYMEFYRNRILREKGVSICP